MNTYINNKITYIIYTTYSNIHDYAKHIINNNPKVLVVLIIFISVNKVTFCYLLSVLTFNNYNLLIFIILAGIAAVSIAYARHTYFYQHRCNVRLSYLAIFLIGCLMFIVIKSICWYFGITECITQLLQSTVLLFDFSEFVLMAGPFERLYNSGVSSHRFNTAGRGPSPSPGPGGDPENTTGVYVGAVYGESSRTEENNEVEGRVSESHNRRVYTHLPLANPLLIDSSLPPAVPSGTLNAFTCTTVFDPYSHESTKDVKKSFKLSLFTEPSERASPEEYAYFKQIVSLIHDGLYRCKTLGIEADNSLTLYNESYDRVEELRDNIDTIPQFSTALDKRNSIFSNWTYYESLMENDIDLGDALHRITNTNFKDPQLMDNFTKLSSFWIRDIKDTVKDRELLNEREVR